MRCEVHNWHSGHVDEKKQRQASACLPASQHSPCIRFRRPKDFQVFARGGCLGAGRGGCRMCPQDVCRIVIHKVNLEIRGRLGVTETRKRRSQCLS